MTPERLAQRDRLISVADALAVVEATLHDLGLHTPERVEIAAARLIAADVRAGEWPRCEHGAVREPCIPCSEAASHTGMHRLAAGSDRCVDCGVRVGPDEGLRAALDATLRRDDLCDETGGEHHTDEYVAAFLIALDVELQGRAALEGSAE